MPSTPRLPISPYGTFSGNLFQYKSFPSLVAFESIHESSPASSSSTSTSSSSSPSPNKCILIGGLSDGLIPTPYSKLLETACHESGWSLVQPLTSSSGMGFGHGTLDRDTEELSTLLHYLLQHRNAQTFAFVGHSTGCQNSVHFLKYADRQLMERVKVVALQAPVSDREDAMLGPAYHSNIQHARHLQAQGREEEMMPRSAFWAPITAKRFLSLQDVGGDDDFFSSDLSDEELGLRLRHMGQRTAQTGLRTLIAYSGQDEYVPQSVNKRELLDRMKIAMMSQSSPDEACHVTIPDAVSTLFLDTGNHNLSNEEGDKETFVEAVKELLQDALQ